MAINGGFDGLHLFGEEVKKEIQHRVQSAARVAFQVVTDLTPVDRGYLKNSWAMSIDRPIYLDLEEDGPGHMADLRRIKSDSTIYLTNGKSYAEYVNDGTSRMPAHQMLEQAVEAALLEL